MPVDIAAIGLKMAVGLVERPATKGVVKLYTWLTGCEVLIIGPARAGKSSFAGYLQHGLLEKELPTPKTVDPISLRASA